jgi:hypothetical protein
MKKPKLEENRKSYFTSIIWMNVEIFCFIVIFYVASLASPQILKKKKKTLTWIVSVLIVYKNCFLVPSTLSPATGTPASTLFLS